MKTGLNFQTCTIINSDKYYKDSSKAAFKYNSTTKQVVVLPGFSFDADKIESVHLAEGFEGKMSQVEIDLSKLTQTTKTYYRLDIYVKVEGAEPLVYANPWVQKGRPFWVEFSLATTAVAADATALVNAINHQHIFQVGDDQIVAKANGTKVILTATVDYLRFAKVNIVKLNDEGDDTEIVAEMITDSAKKANATIYRTETGKNAFGTYSHIIKDLRLPTAENTRWLHLRQDETPVIGAIYDQFILEYKAPANNRPLGAVGCEVNSYTTHVFWVKHELATAFANMFNSSDAGANLTITKVNTTTGVETPQAPTKSQSASELNTKQVKA